MESEAPQGCVGGHSEKNFWSISKNSCFHTTNNWIHVYSCHLGAFHCHQLCDCAKIWQKTRKFLKFPLKRPLLQLLINIWNWRKITGLAWTFSWSRGLLRDIGINARFTTYLLGMYSTDDNKKHLNGMSDHVSICLRCENMSSLLYSGDFFTVAPCSLVGPHFPCIIMAIEGGNSTEAT